MENCNIVLLENVNANSKDELLLAREKHYIKTLKCVNKKVPLRSRPEYRDYNREILNEKGRQYHNDNKERSKEYKNQNKEKIKEQRKIYYEKNKDKLTESFTCCCRGKYTRKGKAQHEKTNRHKQSIETIMTQDALTQPPLLY